MLAVLQPIYGTNSIKDNDLKLKARGEVIEATVGPRMIKLGEYLVGAGIDMLYFHWELPIHFCDTKTFGEALNCSTSVHCAFNDKY